MDVYLPASCPLTFGDCLRIAAVVLALMAALGEAEVLTRTAIEKAKQGDVIALRLCLGFIIAPRRDRPVHFEIPKLNSADDATKAIAAIATGVTRGEVTPSEAAELSSLVEAYVRAIEATEIERRLEALEERQARETAQ